MSSNDCRSRVEMENKESRKLLEHDLEPSEEFFKFLQTEQHICMLIAVLQ